MNICFVQGTYGERIEQSLKSIRRIRPYVDRAIIVVDATVSETQKQKLRDAGCEVYYHEWKDSMVLMRNQLLQKVQTGDFVVATDPDEIYDEEFCKDLRKIIAKAEKEGVGMLLVSAHDETQLINGNVSTSVSGFKKPWVFKKNIGVHYEGIGETKNVHECPVLAPNTKIVGLPDKYFYTHYKHESDILERAARNVFMCGGGGNVGARNVEWGRLRKVCDELGIKNWTQARAYFRRGKIDARLRKWIIDNRYEGVDYEHEMKDFFLWYKWMHPEELEGYEAIAEPRKGGIREVGDFVDRTYRELVGGDIGIEDKEQLTQLIIDGKLSRENLPKVLEAYKKDIEKGDKRMVTKGEKVRLPVPVDVDVHVTEELFEKALLKSKTYWGRIKPKLDLGKFVENMVWDKPKFHRWFYENREEMEGVEGVEKLGNYISRHGIDTIALCVMGYRKGLPMILETIQNSRLHVDEIHVQGDDFTEKDIKTLEGLGCYVHIEPWKEDFSGYKNKLLSNANTHWVLVCDHDEIPTKELAENLRTIIAKSEKGEKFNLVGLQCVGKTVDKKGKIIHTGEKVQGKQNLHVNVIDPYEGSPHVGLKLDYYPWKTTMAPFVYNHIKEEGIDLQRSARNVFLGGGGDNMKEKNALWVGLRSLVKKLKVDSWEKFLGYLKEGNVDDRLKNWFLKARVFPWKDDELTHVEKFYYSLNPKEKPKPDSVSLCIMSERKNLGLVEDTIKKYGELFDEVLVQGNDFNLKDSEILHKLGAKVSAEPWEDEFSEYKNKCIGHAKSEWVLILDYDEVPTPEMAKAIRKLIKGSECGTKYNLVGFDSVIVTWDGKKVKRGKAEKGKELLHLNVKDPYYGTPHIWLKPNYFPWRPIRVDYVYEHIKTEMKVLKQSTLNFFLGGGGDNLREGNPLWVKLRALTDELGLKTWEEFDKYLKKGDVDERLLEIFEEAYIMEWHCPELKAPKKYYYKLNPRGR